MLKRIVSGITLTLFLTVVLTSVRTSSGANIDVYTQYPYPRGGQGPGEPSEAFAPQDEVILFANVTYNDWPEQNLFVIFIVDGAGFYYLLYAVTGTDGVANASFVIPPPDIDPFGTWTVLARASVAGETCEDTLTFEVRSLRKVVPDDYSTIQEAINNANEGDIIYVRNGTYYENVVVNKTVSLIGENRSTTIIDGNKTYPPYVGLINVTSNNVSISGFSIENGYYGIYLSGSNNTVSNNLIRNNYHAVLVENSYFNNISENTITEHDGTAIQVFYSGFNLFKNNFVSNCVIGVHIHYGTNNTIDRNIVTTEYRSVIYGIALDGLSENNLIQSNFVSHFSLGIHLESSRRNTLRNNTMLDNLYNFAVDGDFVSHYIQDIDSSNTVNGKPVYYWIGHHHKQIPSNAGFVGIVNSSHITVRDLDLTGYGAVLLAYTTNSLIQNVTVPSISLISCSNNILTNNTVTGKKKININLRYSSENTIRNTFVTKGNYGIRLYSSERNTLNENTILENDYGICLVESNDNAICDNLVKNNNEDGVNLGGSTNNFICRNRILSNSRYGIVLSGSYNNTLYHNNFMNNTNQVCLSINNTWDNSCEGNYWSDYTGTDLNGDGIGDTELSWLDVDYYPLMNPYIGHNVAIRNLRLSKSVVGEGYTSRMELNITNSGSFPETFNLTIHANTTSIMTCTITLSHLNSTTITFTWNTTGFSRGNYTIGAYATPVSNETDTIDNNYVNGWVVVTIPGDINGDEIIDIYDAIKLAGAYGSTPSSANWNPDADLNNDNIIDIFDAIILDVNYI